MTTEIALATEFFAPVEAGTKTQTIRRGRRDYALGPARFADDSGHSVQVIITSICYKRFCHITDADAQKDGFSGRCELTEALLRFYPDFDEEDEMTLIGFATATV